MKHHLFLPRSHPPHHQSLQLEEYAIHWRKVGTGRYRMKLTGFSLISHSAFCDKQKEKWPTRAEAERWLLFDCFPWKNISKKKAKLALWGKCCCELKSVVFYNKFLSFEEQSWHSGVKICPLLMWPGFRSVSEASRGWVCLWLLALLTEVPV